MRKFVIPELFFKSIAEKGKLYSRLWFFWLSGFADEIFEPDFIEKQTLAYPNVREIKDIYDFGVQLLQQDFEIIADKKSKPIISKEHKEISSKVIEYLNSKAGTTYSCVSGTNANLISGRLKEGFTFSDFKVVIDKKTKEWLGTDRQEYLRPITLFAKSKFENYLNANGTKKLTSFDKYADTVAKAAAEIRSGIGGK